MRRFNEQLIAIAAIAAAAALGAMMDSHGAAAQAQTQSQPVSGHYEREFVPRPAQRSHAQNRLFLAPLPGRSAKARARAVAVGILTTTLERTRMLLLDGSGSAASWPQWGHDPSHSGTINVVGQSPNQV